MKLIIGVVNKSNNELPKYETEGSSGMDLKYFGEIPITLPSLGRALIPTGLYIEMPTGLEMQIRPRSGLAFKKGLTVLNSPGTIDSDYRGEIKVILANLGPNEVTIYPGDRIAQGVFAFAEQVELIEVEEIKDTKRGNGGFGSTGR